MISKAAIGPQYRRGRWAPKRHSEQSKAIIKKNLKKHIREKYFVNLKTTEHYKIVIQFPKLKKPIALYI